MALVDWKAFLFLPKTNINAYQKGGCLGGRRNDGLSRSIPGSRHETIGNASDIVIVNNNDDDDDDERRRIQSGQWLHQSLLSI